MKTGKKRKKICNATGEKERKRERVRKKERKKEKKKRKTERESPFPTSSI